MNTHNHKDDFIAISMRIILHSSLCERLLTKEARKSNNAARELYALLGFHEVALRSGYYSNDLEDGIIMNLDIANFVTSHGPEPRFAMHG